MPREPFTTDQKINLIWIACIAILVVVLCVRRDPPPKETYIELTGGSIAELARNGWLVREDCVIAWHGDTLCEPDALRLAAKCLTEMADKAESEEENR